MKMQKNTSPQKPLKDKVSISLDPDVVTKIQRLAEDDDRTFSSYINKVLKEHIRTMEDPVIE